MHDLLKKCPFCNLLRAVFSYRLEIRANWWLLETLGELPWRLEHFDSPTPLRIQRFGWIVAYTVGLEVYHLPSLKRLKAGAEKEARRPLWLGTSLCLDHPLVRVRNCSPSTQGRSLNLESNKVKIICCSSTVHLEYFVMRDIISKRKFVRTSTSIWYMATSKEIMKCKDVRLCC